MTIQNFDRQNLKTLRADMVAALAAVQAKHGITIEMGNMRFTADRVKISVEANTAVQVSSSDVNVNAPNISTVLRAAMERNGIARTTGRKGETLTGYNANRPKYPFSYQTVRGTRYKQTVEQARLMFGAV